MLSPGELSVQSTFPDSLSMAKKLGALGAGSLRCDSSTPFDVLTNSVFPTHITEQLHMLCCDEPSSAIMSNFQTTSASFSSLLTSAVYGPSFLRSRNPSVSKQTTSPRLVTNQPRSPSINGAQQMPM